MPKLMRWLEGFEKKRRQLTLHDALYQQLQQAIEQGILQAGDKLPTHRALAQQLSIAVATVTKVYKEAESHGLLHAKVGKGSYVSTCPVLPQAIKAHDYKSINLSIIKPQVALADKQLTQQLTLLSAQNQLSDLMDYNTAGGSLTDHQAATHWLSTHNVLLTRKSINICSGAQHGLMVLINTLTQYGDCIAVEALCYPGIISLANQFGRKLIPIAMDEEGMKPESLNQACQQHPVKLVIIVASHQNPTASIMSIKRRKLLANVVIQQRIFLIDDDVYGFLNPELPALSNFIPEYGFYLNSLSKSLLPGLRVGYIVSPEAFQQRIDATIRNTVWMPAPFTLALASKLIHSGQAFSIEKEQHLIALKRQKIATRVLKPYVFSAQENSFHLWLTLPQGLTSKACCEALEVQGVLVSSADYFMVNSQETHTENSTQYHTKFAIRVSLMAAKSDDELTFGLNIIKTFLSTYEQKMGSSVKSSI